MEQEEMSFMIYGFTATYTFAFQTTFVSLPSAATAANAQYELSAATTFRAGNFL